MASFKELKQKLSGKITQENLPEPKTIEENLNSNLEYEECRYLMNLIAKSDFKGTDIQILYNIVLKLQTIIKDKLDSDVKF